VTCSCCLFALHNAGFCDAVNNIAECKWDGGDCCASTCGGDDDFTSSCGINGFSCLDPSASDFGTAEKVAYDDDLFAAEGETTGGG
jgi:hypothetical protein